MGLLDSWNSVAPEEKQALFQGLLSGAFGAMAGRGTPLQAWGQGGLAGLAGYQNSLDAQQLGKARQQQTALGQLQLENQMRAAQKQKQMEALIPQFARSPAQNVLAGGGGPTLANAEKLQTAQPSFDTEGYLRAAMGSGALDLPQIMQANQFLKKDNSPLITKEGDVARDPTTGRVLWSNPKDAEDPFVRLLKSAGVDPASPDGQRLLRDRLAKESTHTPPVNVSYGAPVAGVDAKGNPVFFQPDKKGGTPAIIPGVAPTGKEKTATEFQEKAGLYYKSMDQASSVLNRLEGSQRSDYLPTVAETAAPDKFKGITQTQGRKSYVQAQMQWIDSINRVRSGANLPEIEYNRAVQTFFPTVYDGPAEIKQKAAARAQEEQAMRAAAGPAMKGAPGADNNDPLGLRK